ncbi:MAG: phosphoglycerate dehydrogenase [Desulfovibrionaceae bacterium]|nr:phosphoglycerate dehydrogenase [Desulfovibrionaceae bacterium]
MPTVLITTSSFAEHSAGPLSLLRDKGLCPVPNPHGRRLTEDELLALLAEHSPVGLLAGTEPLTRRVLEAGRGRLKVVSRVGVGWDNVDLDAARELGVAVLRTEGVLDRAVAELALGLILSALRMVPARDREIRRGVWNKALGALLFDKTVGLIGFGAVGRRLGEFVSALGARVVFCDPRPLAAEFATRLSLDELLRVSEIISLHASGQERILGGPELDLCRPGLILVNTARGGLVDEDALYERLADGRVAWACLDVFEHEPYSGRLRDLDNATLTPHIGSYAREARAEMERLAVKNLLRGLGLWEG